MEFMILIHSDENAPAPGPGEPGFDEFMGAWMAYNQSLIAGGHFVSAASLAPTTTATTLRRLVPGQAPEVLDGPYVETKEQFGGFYIIKAESLDEAIELATALPMGAGSLEIRPVALRPDAE
jgi:hypothetical protein